MGHLQIIRQGLQSTRNKTPNTELEDKFNTNVFFCTIVYPITSQEGNIYSNLCGRFPITSNKSNKYISIMYVYDCNAIMKTSMKNRIDKDVICALT